MVANRLTDADLVIIVGGGGFLGTHLAESLAHEGSYVLTIDGVGCLLRLDRNHEVDLPAIRVDRSNRNFLAEFIEHKVHLCESDLARRRRTDEARLRVSVVLMSALDRKVESVLKVAGVDELVEQDLSEIFEATQAGVEAAMVAAYAVRWIAELGRLDSIVFVSSIYGVTSPDQRVYGVSQSTPWKPANYSASRAACISLARYFASLYGSFGVRSNAVVLGGVMKDQDPAFVRSYSERTMLGRMNSVDDFVGAVKFLLSDWSSGVTGSALTVDCGLGGW